MKTLNLGYSEFEVSKSNAIFLNRDFNLIPNPTVYVKGEEKKKNFDCLFIFDGEYNRRVEILKYHKVPYIGIHRETKDVQQLILNNFGFKTPPFYKEYENMFHSYERYDFYHILLEDLDDEDEIVIKHQNGARGLGQILTKKKELYNIFEYAEDVDFLNKLNIGGIEKEGDIRLNLIKSMLSGNEFYITKKIEVVNEYRLMAFYGESPILVKRNKDSNHWQRNVTITNDYEIVKDYKEVFNEDFNEKIQNFLLYLNTPWLSMDLYEDEKGNLGFFEYQMQYGYKALPKNEIVDKTNKSVFNLLKYNKFI